MKILIPAIAAVVILTAVVMGFAIGPPQPWLVLPAPYITCPDPAQRLHIGPPHEGAHITLGDPGKQAVSMDCR